MADDFLLLVPWLLLRRYYSTVLMRRMRRNVTRKKVKQKTIDPTFCASVNCELEYFFDEATEGALTDTWVNLRQID